MKIHPIINYNKSINFLSSKPVSDPLVEVQSDIFEFQDDPEETNQIINGIISNAQKQIKRNKSNCKTYYQALMTALKDGERQEYKGWVKSNDGELGILFGNMNEDHKPQKVIFCDLSNGVKENFKFIILKYGIFKPRYLVQYIDENNYQITAELSGKKLLRYSVSDPEMEYVCDVSSIGKNKFVTTASQKGIDNDYGEMYYYLRYDKQHPENNLYKEYQTDEEYTEYVYSKPDSKWVIKQ